MSSSPRYNRRKRGGREHSSYVLVGNLPNNVCARPLERWLCDFCRSLRVGRCCRDGKSSESWCVRVYGDKNDLEQFAADYKRKQTAFFDRHLTVSDLIETKTQDSPQRQRYVWKYKNGQGRFSEYNNTVSSQIESLRAGEGLDIPVGRNSYRVKRTDSTNGVQLDLRTHLEVPIVREGPCAPQPQTPPPNLMSDADVIENLLCLDVNQPELTPAFWASLDDQKCATSAPSVTSLTAQKQQRVSRLIPVKLTEKSEEMKADASILANRARDHFRASLSSIDYEIVSIKLCVNSFAFQHYQYFRKVRQRYAVQDLNERFLFHGTTDENINGIVAGGFLRDYGKTEIFGHGCYFATTAAGSVPYAPRDEGGIQRLLWCIVVCGEPCLGTPNAKRPRRKQNGYEYETMVQSFATNDVVVVPNDHQAYPLAVIEFKSVRGSSVGSMENGQLSAVPPIPPSTASPPMSTTSGFHLSPMSPASWQSIPSVMNMPIGGPMMQAAPMTMGSVPMVSSVPTQPWIGAGMPMQPFIVMPPAPQFLPMMTHQGPGSSVSLVPGGAQGGNYGLYPANVPGPFSGHS